MPKRRYGLPGRLYGRCGNQRTINKGGSRIKEISESVYDTASFSGISGNSVRLREKYRKEP